DGQTFFSTKREPGWTRGDETIDPRPLKAGPLPNDWARFKGLYRNGNRVVLRYSVGDAEVYETPWFEWHDGKPLFTRTITVGPGQKGLRMVGEKEIPPRDKPITFSIPASQGASPKELCQGGPALWPET